MVLPGMSKRAPELIGVGGAAKLSQFVQRSNGELEPFDEAVAGIPFILILQLYSALGRTGTIVF
jgi:hypothetical protein